MKRSRDMFSAPQRRAMAINGSINRKFPYKEWGRMYVKRGTPDNIEEFGTTYREATPKQRGLRRQWGYVGRGKYSLGRNYRKSGIGRAVAGGVRSLIGAGVGRLTGGGLYTGRGAYVGNSLVSSGGVAQEVPHVSSAADETGAVTVSRREYISDIYGPAGNAFDLMAFAINPGIEATFPWLSQIAQNYEEYELLQCIFTYRSTTSDITTNGQVGTIVMATNYNVGTRNFTDKVVMMEYDGAMSGKVTESVLHGVECDPAKLSGSVGRYVRANPVVNGQDIKSFDHGTFQLAVCNSPSQYNNAVIGELWVSYTVKLRKPKFFVARGLGISRDLFCSNTGESTTRPFGNPSLMLRGQQNNIGGRFVDNTRGLGPPTWDQATETWSLGFNYLFPAGYAGTVAVRVYLEGTATMDMIWGAVVLIGNVRSVSDMYAASASAGDSASTNTSYATTTGGFYELHLLVTPSTGGVDNTFSIPYNLTTGTPTQSYFIVEEYNSGFSYASNNLGTSDAPILVQIANTSTVVVP